MEKAPAPNKGLRMEEHLRAYFLKAGYYVLRGVPFTYERFDVTDIDLWLYNRASSVSREIIIVDLKNKKTPQAIERIFWVQGLRSAIGATSAIVATMDNRQAVKDFGREQDVLVLDGSFLQKLSASSDLHGDRLSEEDFRAKLSNYSLEKLDGDWKGRITRCKGLLSRGLNFDNCNEWIEHAQFFAEQVITKPSQREIAIRCLYLVSSLLLIAVDYALKDTLFLEHVERVRQLKDGFTYGSRGSAGIKRVIDTSLGLVEQFTQEGAVTSNKIRASIERQFRELPTNILSEYFSRLEVAHSLYSQACELEDASMCRTLKSYNGLSVETRSTLACLLDYWRIDRRRFIESTEGF